MANPRGFCAGVRRAIDIVEKIIKIYGIPIYVRHELVHNDYVINSLSKKGVIFVNTVDEVPNGSILVFSAHGVSKKIKEQAKIKNLIVFDATCPLVTKVHLEVFRASLNEMEVILIGHSGHPEVEGIIGQYVVGLYHRIYIVESESDAWSIQVHCPDNLFFVTQTTLSVDDTSKIISILRQRFPNIIGPKKSDICYATFNRQNALKKLAEMVDIILVIGSHTSSNANRLFELACRIAKKCAYLINYASDIQKNWLYAINSIGITAGASVPDILISDIIDKLYTFNIDSLTITEMSEQKENVFFNVPESLIKIKNKNFY